jgi:uncharacterized protein (TIGR01777 family)
MTVVITGGTGTIGKRLSAMLVARGYRVIILSRKPKPAEAGGALTYAQWNVEKGEIDEKAINAADYIIHLAGAGVAEGRWTAKRKQEIIDSRTQSSALLVNALRNNKNAVKAIISASATGWYGADTPANTQNGFKEDAPADNDFLGTTCRLWEESIEPVTQLGIRLVKLRTGIVLSNNGGAYIEFKKPLKAGLATIMGDGKQVVSWVHVDDICRMYIYALENKNVQGVYNAVAPNPVNNKTLILQIAKQLNGKWFIPVPAPAFALKLVLGEMSIEILKSVTVSSAKIQAAGFQFLYPTIEEAVKDLGEKK